MPDNSSPLRRRQITEAILRRTVGAACFVDTVDIHVTPSIDDRDAAEFSELTTKPVLACPLKRPYDGFTGRLAIPQPTLELVELIAARSRHQTARVQTALELWTKTESHAEVLFTIIEGSLVQKFKRTNRKTLTFGDVEFGTLSSSDFRACTGFTVPNRWHKLYLERSKINKKHWCVRLEFETVHTATARKTFGSDQLGRILKFNHFDIVRDRLCLRTVDREKLYRMIHNAARKRTRRYHNKSVEQCEHEIKRVLGEVQAWLAVDKRYAADEVHLIPASVLKEAGYGRALVPVETGEFLRRLSVITHDYAQFTHNSLIDRKNPVFSTNHPA